MARFARVHASRVVEIITIPDDADLADFYHPDIVAALKPVGGEVVQGWTFDGTSFNAPPPPAVVVISQSDLLAYAAQRRATIERAGYAWTGGTVMTDSDSLSKLSSERLAVLTGDRVDGDPWIMVEGPVTLTNAEIEEISTEVRSWVKGLFVAQAGVSAAIIGGTVTTFEQIDDAFDA